MIRTLAGFFSLGLAALLASIPLSAAEDDSSTDSPAPGVEPVTLVFYNLRNYLAMERRVAGEVVEDAPKPEPEVEAVIDALAELDPDILGVCEIGAPAFLEDLQKRLAEAGVDLPHTELLRSASGYDRNLALITRFPIVARGSRDDYTYEIGDKRLPFQRGVLDVTIAVRPRYHLRYVGLHLKSKREVPEADQAMMRLNEARLARRHVDRILEAEPGTNLLVVGDLNDLRIEPPVKTLQGSYGHHDYLTSLTLDDRFGFRWTHHWSYADAYSRFDFVLYSRGISPELQRDGSFIHHWPAWDEASDHRPLVVRITPEDQ